MHLCEDLRIRHRQRKIAASHSKSASQVTTQVVSFKGKSQTSGSALGLRASASPHGRRGYARQDQARNLISLKPAQSQRPNKSTLKINVARRDAKNLFATISAKSGHSLFKTIPARPCACLLGISPFVPAYRERTSLSTQLSFREKLSLVASAPRALRPAALLAPSWQRKCDDLK
jgi:hypothetical protein